MISVIGTPKLPVPGDTSSARDNSNRPNGSTKTQDGKAYYANDFAGTLNGTYKNLFLELGKIDSKHIKYLKRIKDSAQTYGYSGKILLAVENRNSNFFGTGTYNIRIDIETGVVDAVCDTNWHSASDHSKTTSRYGIEDLIIPTGSNNKSINITRVFNI